MEYEAESPRLWLERLTIEEHLEDFWDIWRSPEALIWSTQKPKETLEEARAWMATTLPNDTNPSIEKFALLLRPIPENPQPWTNSAGKPKMMGFVGTNRFSPSGLEVGYCMNIAYWGRGYAGEAFAAFLELYWKLGDRKEMGINELVAKIDPDNVASRKIVQRVGARKGELLTDIHPKPGGGPKGDLQCWYLSRPGFEEENLRAWKKRIQEIEEEKRQTEGKEAIVSEGMVES